MTTATRTFGLAIVLFCITVGLVSILTRQVAVPTSSDEERSMPPEVTQPKQTKHKIQLRHGAHINFEPQTIDLTQHYISAEQAEVLAANDKKFVGPSYRQNDLKEFKTEKGIFRRVGSYGHYSTNPSAKNDKNSGHRHETIGLPTGEWVYCDAPLWLKQVIELDGDVYWICPYHIFRYVDATTLERVVFSGYEGRKPHPLGTAQGNELIGGRFLIVEDSMHSFLGLLGYVEDRKWSFFEYQNHLLQGQHHWIPDVNYAEEINGSIILLLSPDENSLSRTILFDTATQKFSDL